MAPPDIPQLLLPLTLTADGDIATIEQGDTRDVVQRVAVLTATRRGTVDGSPNEGLNDPRQLEGGPDIAEIEQQIATYVPDAAAVGTEDPDALNAGLARIGVKVGA